VPSLVHRFVTGFAVPATFSGRARVRCLSTVTTCGVCGIGPARQLWRKL
jgi:hypothetical protein